MVEFFVRTHLVAKDQKSFDKALDEVARITPSETSPGLKGFAVCVLNEDQHGILPNNDDPLSIMVVERYTDIAHRKPWSIDSSLLDNQTTIISQPIVDLTRNVDHPQTGLIITASFLYQMGRSRDAIAGWDEFVKYVGETEDETYGYSVFHSLATLSTFEVYSNAEYVAKVHVKSPALAKNGQQNGQWRVQQGIYASRWHLVGGFLYKA